MGSLRWRRRRYELSARLGGTGYRVGGAKHLLQSVLRPAFVWWWSWRMRLVVATSLAAASAALLAAVGFPAGDAIVGGLLTVSTVWLALGVASFLARTREVRAEGDGPTPPGAGQREPRRPSPTPPTLTLRRPVPDDPSR